MGSTRLLISMNGSLGLLLNLKKYPIRAYTKMTFGKGPIILKYLTSPDTIYKCLLV